MSDSRPPRAPDSGPAGPPPEGTAAVGLSARRDRPGIPREFGRYRLIDCLGRGGMGAVFKAHDTQLDRVVALKAPYLDGGDAGTRERFYREARAAAALHHANICPVYDVGELYGIPYLTMAYVEGRSLGQMLVDGLPFTPHRAAHLVRKLALAMQAAHAKGVVHRDLKPANVLMRADGEPVITDFGLARRADDRPGAGLTRQGDLIGTLEYMSPEQLDGDNAAVGPSADVYALGVVLYELLTGRRPFAGSTARMLVSIMLHPPPRPGELRPGLPERLEEICLTAMAKRPEDRYPTMAAFAADLTAYLRSHGPGGESAAARSAEAPPTPRPSATTRPIHEPAARPAPAVSEDPGWELVEDPPPRPPTPPRRVVRGKLVPRRKKAKTGTYRPVIVGGVAAAVVCLGLVIAAVVVWSGGGSRPAAPALPPPTAPAERGTAKPPSRVGPAGESSPRTPGTPNR